MKLVARINDMVWLEGPVLISCASLAQHGLLKSMEIVRLKDVSLSTVPAEHLASLASCVSSVFLISNVSGCNMVNIMDSVRCQSLRFYNQRLGTQETRALVRAMETRVEVVWLANNTTVDIMAFTKYSGKGECWELQCWNSNNEIQYRVELRQWGRDRQWQINKDDMRDIAMQSTRKLKAIRIKEELKQLEGGKKSNNLKNEILQSMDLL